MSPLAAPDAAMMTGPEALARFLETSDQGILRGVFSAGEVTILENFPPHVFTGQDGLAHWQALMARHVGAIDDLRHAFGPPQDFGRTGDTVYFSLPTRWTGVRDGQPFDEHGGWSFVQALEGGRWRIRAYGWSVVSFTQ
ncbi:hypothetical protein [Caulobacter sp. UNC279MFTsu5.1]|uniref:hypothetical protein n=1 Tax=Caulobacter sp. UNC279MFTsu5.1 TaxID=1502775 RepID=UPI0008F0020A|nr:hypothetical protein [Caulobacter sp. UNC279MFTsu5.1]SFK74886.1 hypothetical protein SAMN02799626_05067 [Caulobacter sp. UNC279MFTsu5.1]